MAQNEDLQKEYDNENAPRKAPIFAIIMGCIMVLIYMCMAFLLLFTSLFFGKMPEWVRYLMGVVFFVYGVFRGYRVYKSNR